MKLSTKITNTIYSVNQWLVDHPMASIVTALDFVTAILNSVWTKLRPVKYTNSLVEIHGLEYPVTIADDWIKIGCQSYSPQRWADFTDAQISRMAPDALMFWQNYGQIILTLSELKLDK